MTDPEPFDIVPLSSWDDLVRELDHLSPTYFYRGQRDAEWPLRTTLERHMPPDLEHRVAEERLFREFTRRAHAYLPANQLPLDDGEWLALMQHFGAPTRLLDFTRSPFVAAYFAFEDACDAKTPCAVWAVQEVWCRESGGQLLVDRLKRLQPAIRESLAGQDLSDPWNASVVAGERFQHLVLTNLAVAVLPFEPHRLSERLSVQQGTFLCCADVRRTFMQNLAALGVPPFGAKAVVKFTVPSTERPRALEQLRLMNITRASLFPGLEGFAQSFRQLLFKEPYEHQQRRLSDRRLSGRAPLYPGVGGEIIRNGSNSDREKP